MRRTKIICTIGPKTASFEALSTLTSLGMDIARLNMSHGDYEWHSQVIRAIKTINGKGNASVGILLDTKGPEIRSGDLKKDLVIEKGDTFIFTIDKALGDEKSVEISYDGFVKEAKVGDIILIDSGMMTFEVKAIEGKNIVTICLDGGTLTSRRHVNIQGKSAKLPTITKKDWEDIKFGIEQGVDFIALSFVKEAKAIKDLKKYIQKVKAHVDVIAKIESASAIPNLDAIIKASDGVMVARGDLGAELPLEEVPLIQEDIVAKSLQFGKPVIIATHLLESMIENPTPTRAEVADIAESVRERADAMMLSAETATGEYPFKALEVMATVAKRIEKKVMENKGIPVLATSDPRIELSRSASIMANNLDAKAIIVFTRRGFMAANVSRCRPGSPIFAFTNMTSIRRRLNLYWGVTAFRIQFSNDPEKTIQRALELLRGKKLLKKDERIILVSDILAGKEFVETIQIRKIG